MKPTNQTADPRYQNLPGFLKVILILLPTLSIGLVVFYVFGFYVQGRPLLTNTYYYFLFALLTPIGFISIPARKKDIQICWYDLIAAVLSFTIPIYLAFKAKEITELGWVPSSPFNFALAVIFCILLFEMSRRGGGIVFSVICLITASYPLYADQLPGMLSGLSYSLNEVASAIVFGTNGLLGLPSKVMGELLLAFIIFAGVLIASGAGAFFLDLSLAILGKFRGGPAKVAVLSSGFFGSLSGSVFSNILATGSITIPAMKRTGFPPHYAGAIEACASTGGAFMPPVMGATAFIMTSLLNLSYADVMISAAIPACLYYFGLLIQIDSFAARKDMKGIPAKDIPSVKSTLKRGWPYIAVLLFLLWGLVVMRWEVKAPLYASALMFILSFTSRETALTPKRLLNALVRLGKLMSQTWFIIIPLCLILSPLATTGSIISMTAAIIAYGGENMLLLLAIGVLSCYILGMVGVGTAAYIFLAVTLAPAVMQVGGLDVLAVHLFIVYYAVMSGITPPVAIGAFLAADLAGASPMKTAVTSMRLGVVLYFVPFFFVFNPSLLLRGTVNELFCLFPFALLGVFILASGMEGYLIKLGKIDLWARPILVIAGLLVGFPEWVTTFIGFALTLVVIVILIAWNARKTTIVSDNIIRTT